MKEFYPAPAAPDAALRMDLEKLPPILRALLVSDGTETRLLEAYYWEAIQIKTLFHGDHETADGIPALDVPLGGHVLHRRVVLRGGESDRIYSHASSFIRADLLWPEIHDELVQGRRGIGEVLRERRTETYRELLTCECAADAKMAVELSVASDESLIRRSYRIFANRAPCIYIIEHFPISLYV